MMEFDRQGLPRRSSASTLDEQAGTRAGFIRFCSLAAACRQHCQIAWQCSHPCRHSVCKAKDTVVTPLGKGSAALAL